MELPTWKGAYYPCRVNPLSVRLFNHPRGVESWHCLFLGADLTWCILQDEFFSHFPHYGESHSHRHSSHSAWGILLAIPIYNNNNKHKKRHRGPPSVASLVTPWICLHTNVRKGFINRPWNIVKTTYSVPLSRSDSTYFLRIGCYSCRHHRHRHGHYWHERLRMTYWRNDHWITQKVRCWIRISFWYPISRARFPMLHGLYVAFYRLLHSILIWSINCRL